MSDMRDNTYVLLRGLLSSERHQTLKYWRDAWQMWPGAQSIPDVMVYWAQRLQRLNDAQIELEAEGKRGA